MADDQETQNDAESLAPPAETTPTPEVSAQETPTQEQPAAEPVADEAAEPSIAEGLDIGSEAAADEAAKPAPLIRGKIDRLGVAMGTGRRKTAVARVRIKDGSGKIMVNDRELAEFFTLERDQLMIQAPLKITEMAEKVDVWVRVKGGGSTGQTGAVILGIARALEAKNPGLHSKLSEEGFLTRDGRMVERKKYGHKKARRSFQFSKR
jgi:small subunit ribosomal protein S9